jgi:hypothetical protein
MNKDYTLVRMELWKEVYMHCMKYDNRWEDPQKQADKALDNFNTIFKDLKGE